MADKLFKKTKFKIYNIVSVLFLLCLTGNYFVHAKYSFSVTLFLLFQVIVLVFTNKPLILNKRILFFVVIFSFVAVLGLAFNSFEDASSYIAIFMQLIGTIFVCSLIDYDEFELIFVRCMEILAIISLIFWLIGLLYPSFAHNFPMTVRNDLNLRYYNAYVYVFWEETGWGLPFLSNRNSGIFSEPGMYQVFLCLALFFLLKREKRKYISILIICITIATTFSLSGYIIAILILLSDAKNRKKISGRIMVLLFFVAIIAIGFSSTIISSRVNLEYFIERTSLDKIPLLLSKANSYVCGYTFTGRSALAGNVWNSIIDSCFVFGIPFVVYLLCNYWTYCRCFYKSKVLFVALLLIFSVESLIWRPFFFCLIIYGMLGNSKYYSEKGNLIYE